MSRLDINKTYKLYIGGKFPRTESGRYYTVNNNKGNLIANMCLASRKDIRNAVVIARKAQSSWANTTALNTILIHLLVIRFRTFSKGFC